jgi:uncharacterized protein
MKIAVVGGGIAGLASAWLLSRRHQVILFERDERLGGHTHTHDVEQRGRRYAVDSGFIVFNPENYPLLTRLFAELGVATQPTAMSFAVQAARSGLEYSSRSLDTFFCQRRNLVSPSFLRMARDIVRFYREAPALLSSSGPGPSIGDYLRERAYSSSFVEHHLVPLASALWSSPAERIRDFPARFLVRFMDQHRMLQLHRPPSWRVVKGGSRRYVEALRASWRAEVRRGTPVTAVRRGEDHVDVATAAGVERCDHVVLACHADQALALLAEPTADERRVLGAMTFQANDVVLHSDRALLPRDEKAWAAWNAYVPASPGAPCTVSYNMNVLMSLRSRDPFVVTLNRGEAVAEPAVLARMQYHHPLHTHASVEAQAQKKDVDGKHRVWFCGAYWGFGFHEDGLRSAVGVARELGVAW